LELGKWMVLAGCGLVACGALVWLLGRMGLPLGSLPGDIRPRDGGGGVYFPVVTCIIVSVVLTVVVNLILRLLGR
jgi:hypothetical protein